MREVQGDLWAIEADARCITTNGSIKQEGNGVGVMGRGVARDAKQRYPDLEKRLGNYLRQYGHHVGVLLEVGEAGASMPLVVLPTKHQWYDKKANVQLIKQSLKELTALADERGWQTVALPRPGCGAGQLPWATIVRILCEKLDDRFVVVFKGTGYGWDA